MDADDDDPVYDHARVFALCLNRSGRQGRSSARVLLDHFCQHPAFPPRSPARDEAARVHVRGIVIVRGLP